MKRTINIGWGNLKVGIVLLFAVAGALWATLAGTGASIFESKTEFMCYFADVNGLLPGSPVWMAGVEVGNVTGVQFANLDSLRQVEVTCKVKSGVWDMMTEGTTVALGTIGLIGDKFVDIVPGPPENAALVPGTTVPTRDAGSAGAMFAEGEAAIGEARTLVNNLDGVIGKMNRGEGTLGQLAVNDTLYAELTNLAAHLTSLSAALQKNQERITGSLEQTAQSVANLTERVEQNEGTIGRLMNDPKLYDNLNSSTAKLDTIMHKIDRAEGSMGLLVNDTALYTEVVELVDRVNNLVADIQKDPKKYFGFSIF
ncbi:MCE family protein [candidate division GN15 bacterium]|nr:MCE family protein [candidate division GN15 bacterium]